MTDDEKPRERRLLDIVMWSLLALAIASTLLWRFLASDEAGATIEWRCLPVDGRTVECVFESDKPTEDGACFDLILECDDAEHRARVCSGALEKDQPKRVDAGDFEPPLPEKPSCRRPRYQY